MKKKELVDRLKMLMKEYDLSPSDLAEKIDVSRASISHILSERNNPSREFVTKLFIKFPQIDPYWFLTGMKKEKEATFPNYKSEDTKNPLYTNVNKSKNELTNVNNTPNDAPSPIKESNKLAQKIEKTDTIERVLLFYSDETFKVLKNRLSNKD